MHRQTHEDTTNSRPLYAHPWALSVQLFLAITLLYYSFSPGSIGGMGYLSENMKACQQITALLAGSPDGPSGLAAVDWPRHGFVELVVEMPFFLVGHWLGGGSPAAESALLSFELSVLSAGICALLFLWVLRLTGKAGWALLLSLGAAFGTMLWPYAYIGLEPTQSFFLLLAGYLVLATPERGISWGRTWTVALVLAVTISVKSNGIFLIPVAGFLGITYLRPTRRMPGGRLPVSHAAVLFLVAAGMFVANRLMVGLFWQQFSGHAFGFLSVAVSDWMAVPFNLFSYLGSINKSLLIFAPITALALWSIPTAWHKDRAITAFALLALLGMAGGLSLTRYWADEAWGPRYLHMAVAPLVLLVAITRVGRRPRLSREPLLVATLVLGVFVSSLGSFFYYGALPMAARMTAQSTVENYQYNPVWNHVRFNARLFDIWLGWPVLGISSEPLWIPQERWQFRRTPPGAPPWKTVDLRAMAVPQPALVRYWRGKPVHLSGIWWVFPFAAVLGALSLGVIVVRSRSLSEDSSRKVGFPGD